MYNKYCKFVTLTDKKHQILFRMVFNCLISLYVEVKEE